MKIIGLESCGNSPKAKLIAQAEIAFAERDFDSLLELVCPDVCWDIVGDLQVQGASELAALLRSQNRAASNEELTITHVITHGKVGAISGLRRQSDGSTIEFCSVFVFANARGDRIIRASQFQIAVD